MKEQTSVIIRKADAADLEAVYGLIKELAIFENAPNEPSNSLKNL